MSWLSRRAQLLAESTGGTSVDLKNESRMFNLVSLVAGHYEAGISSRPSDQLAGISQPAGSWLSQGSFSSYFTAVLLCNSSQLCC